MPVFLASRPRPRAGQVFTEKMRVPLMRAAFVACVFGEAGCGNRLSFRAWPGACDARDGLGARQAATPFGVTLAWGAPGEAFLPPASLT